MGSIFSGDSSLLLECSRLRHYRGNVDRQLRDLGDEELLLVRGEELADVLHCLGPVAELCIERLVCFPKLYFLDS